MRDHILVDFIFIIIDNLRNSSKKKVITTLEQAIIKAVVTKK